MFFQRKRRPITYMSEDRSNQNQTEIKPFQAKNLFCIIRVNLHASVVDDFFALCNSIALPN